MPSSFGDFGNFGLSNQTRGFTRETVHPWILEAQKNALSQVGLIGRGAGGSGGGGFAGGIGGAPQPTQPGGPDGYKELSDSLLGQLQGAGASQRESIGKTFDTSLNSSLARLADRGWGNSSLVETTTADNASRKQSAMTELEDSLLQQRVGVQQNLGLAGLNAQQRNQQMQQQMFMQLFGGLFG